MSHNVGSAQLDHCCLPTRYAIALRRVRASDTSPNFSMCFLAPTLTGRSQLLRFLDCGLGYKSTSFCFAASAPLESYVSVSNSVYKLTDLHAGS